MQQQERRAASRQAEIGVEWHSVEGHRVAFGEPMLVQDEPRRVLPIALTAGVIEVYKRIVRRQEVTR